MCNKKTFPSYNSEWFFWITISTYCKNIFQKVRLNFSNFHRHHNIVSHAFIAQILFHGPQRNEVLVDIIGCIYASVCLLSSSFSHFLYKLLWALVVMMCYYGFKQLFEIFTITSTWSKQQLPCNNCNTTVALKHKNKHMQHICRGPPTWVATSLGGANAIFGCGGVNVICFGERCTLCLKLNPREQNRKCEIVLRRFR